MKNHWEREKKKYVLKRMDNNIISSSLFIILIEDV